MQLTVRKISCNRCGKACGQGEWKRRPRLDAKGSEVLCLPCVEELADLKKTRPKKQSTKPPCPYGEERNWAHHLTQKEPLQPFVCVDCGFHWFDEDTLSFLSRN